MSFTRAENNLQQSASKAIANHTQGNGGISMPAVPVLQNKPVQKKEEEQQQENLPDVDQQQATQLKSAMASDGVIQREVENKKVDDSDLGNVANEFFDYIDGLAREAYQFAVTVPSLGPYVELDGHTELWGEKWNAILNGEIVHLLAATFGYVVESLVSNSLGPYHPVAPDGFTIYYQVVVGGTRPDLVLRETATGADIAWVDLTAENSGGHIFLKDSWDKRVARYAEITYPSLDQSTYQQMLANRDNTTTLTAEEFEERRQQVRAAYELKKQQWIELGQNYKYKNLSGQIGYSKMLLDINPKLKRDFIIARLKNDFGVDEINEQLVPSILSAMGVGSGPWGFLIGTSSSNTAGEAWLTDHDPTAEQIEANGPVEEDAGGIEEEYPGNGAAIVPEEELF